MLSSSSGILVGYLDEQWSRKENATTDLNLLSFFSQIGAIESKIKFYLDFNKYVSVTKLKREKGIHSKNVPPISTQQPLVFLPEASTITSVWSILREVPCTCVYVLSHSLCILLV